MKLNPAFKHKAEGIAVDWRYKLKLRFYAPLPADKLLEQYNGKAVTPDKLELGSPSSRETLMRQNDWSAGIIRPKPLLIVYHPDSTTERYESSIMHELAHIILKHPLIGFHRETGLPMREQVYEEEATYLGSCLQIPRLGLDWASNKGLNKTEIAAHFGASESMVNFRMNMTGILIF
jgi:hypothetical protein